MTRHRNVVLLGVAVASAGLGFLARGQVLRSGVSRPVVSGPDQIFASVSGVRATASPFVPSKESSLPEPAAVVPSQTYAAASMLVDNLLDAMNAYCRTLPAIQPSEAVGHNAGMIKGMIEGAIVSQPELVPAIRARITDRACQAGISEVGWLTVGRIGFEHPELLTENALECALSGDNLKEGPVLWSLMDAWRLTKHPKPDALLALEATAKDPKTIRRFLDPLVERERQVERLERLSQQRAEAAHVKRGSSASQASLTSPNLMLEKE